MIEKLAYAIEMAFEVPDIEKQVAMVALERFEAVINVMNLAKDHLDVMYEPFKKHENIPPEAVVEKRGVINRYKQQVKKNYSKVKKYSLFAIDKLNYFATDTHILELINSFRDSMQDVEKQVTILLNILDDYESPDFRNNVIASIEGVKKQSAQVEKIIQDRIIDHVDTNILAKNWMTNTGDELKIKIKNRVPVITQLYNERQEVLENPKPNAIPQINKRPQALNPGNAQRILSPTDLRGATTEE